MSQFDPSDFKSVTLSKAFNVFNILSLSESTIAPSDGGGDGGGEWQMKIGLGS